METIKLCHALTETIFHSLLQALVIYLFAKAIVYILPWMSSSFRYNVFYSALCLIFFLFISKLLQVPLSGNQHSLLISPSAAPVIEAGLSIKSILKHHAFWIGSLYLSGIFVQFILLGAAMIKVQAYRKSKYLYIDAEWQKKLSTLKRRLGIDRQVLIYTGDRISSPFTMGWIKPVIFFPLAAFNNLTAEQVEAILVHELAHIKRNDYLHNLIQRFIEIVLFFNPVTWLLASDIRREREFCCDDLVLKQTQSGVSYAKALFLLEHYRMSPVLLQAKGNSKHTLLSRIKRITSMDASGSTGSIKLVILSTLLVSVLFFGWIRPEAIARQTASLPRIPAPAAVATRQLPEAPAPPPALKVAFLPADTLRSDTSGREHLQKALRAKIDEATEMAASIRGQEQAIAAYFESEEWKQHVKEIEKQADQLRHQAEKLRAESEQMRLEFNEKEWPRMEKLQKELEQTFNSKEWEEHSKKIKAHAEAVAKRFNDQAWQEKMKGIQLRAEETQRRLERLE